jgi:hypothetical protein
MSPGIECHLVEELSSTALQERHCLCMPAATTAVASHVFLPPLLLLRGLLATQFVPCADREPNLDNRSQWSSSSDIPTVR